MVRALLSGDAGQQNMSRGHLGPLPALNEGLDWLPGAEIRDRRGWTESASSG